MVEVCDHIMGEIRVAAHDLAVPYSEMGKTGRIVVTSKTHRLSLLRPLDLAAPVALKSPDHAILRHLLDLGEPLVAPVDDVRLGIGSRFVRRRLVYDAFDQEPWARDPALKTKRRMS